MDNQPEKTRQRRARYEDVQNLERQLAVLSAQLDELRQRQIQEKGVDPTLPMTREMFYAYCIIGTIISGGWSHLKYAHQRSEQAYQKWVEMCAAPAMTDVSGSPV